MGAQRRQNQHRPAQDQQGSRAPVAQQDDHRGYQCITEEDVPLPQLHVEESDSQQQQVAPQAQHCRSALLLRGPVAEQGDTSAEQQREEPHELLVDEYLAESAYEPVQPGLRTARREVEVRTRTETVGDYVHYRYCQYRDSPDHVQVGVAGAQPDRPDVASFIRGLWSVATRGQAAAGCP